MQRQSVYFALLCVAEHLAAGTVGIGQVGGKTVRALFDDAERRREIQSAAERAREVVSEWIASEPRTFPPLSMTSGGALVAQTHASVKRIAGVRYKDRICFLPGELRGRLASHGISSGEVVAAWNDAGLLDVDGGRKTKRMRWDGKRIAVFALDCAAIGIDAAESKDVQTSADFSDE